MTLCPSCLEIEHDGECDTLETRYPDLVEYERVGSPTKW